MPKLTIVLPVFNGLKYITEAINSITSQSFNVFELIIINDGSTDDSEQIIKTISDPRLNLVNQKNQGLAATLNNGIKLSKGQYIARLDQDDLMLQSRLEKQFKFLESHPNCAMVGTWSEIWVGDHPTSRGHYHPTSHYALQLELMFDNPFVHSSMMIRADVLRDIGGYCEDKSRQPPEDYELWSRIARKHEVANIPEVLTVYREVEGSMSRTGENPFLKNVIQISAENLAVILAPKYDFNMCYQLASLYHGKEHDVAKRKLKKKIALSMHKQVAMLIAGNVSSWSKEFITTFKKQKSQLKSRFHRRFIPKLLLIPARSVRNIFRHGLSCFVKGR